MLHATPIRQVIVCLIVVAFLSVSSLNDCLLPLPTVRPSINLFRLHDGDTLLNLCIRSPVSNYVPRFCRGSGRCYWQYQCVCVCACLGSFERNEVLAYPVVRDMPTLTVQKISVSLTACDDLIAKIARNSPVSHRIWTHSQHPYNSIKCSEHFDDSRTHHCHCSTRERWAEAPVHDQQASTLWRTQLWHVDTVRFLTILTAARWLERLQRNGEQVVHDEDAAKHVLQAVVVRELLQRQELSSACWTIWKSAEKNAISSNTFHSPHSVPAKASEAARVGDKRLPGQLFDELGRKCSLQVVHSATACRFSHCQVAAFTV